MSRHARQREKTLVCYCPICGATMTATYDGTGDQWERSTDIPARCPSGHVLTNQCDGAITEACDLQDVLHAILDQRARDGVGDFDPRDLCGYSEGRR